VTKDPGYPKGDTPLDRNELGGLKHRHITTRKELDELEQANIQSGLIWLQRQRSDILADNFATMLHKQLFSDVWDWAGTFRRTGKTVGIDPHQIGVHLRQLMDDARYWVDHKTYPASEAAVRLHHRLAYIHPFPNGNGRHARIMADAMLEHVYKTKPIDWAGGYDLQQMNDRRNAYIAALKAADRDDLGPLLTFIGPRDDLK
jgi:Fic-DOC domain mobile mystery protein B